LIPALVGREVYDAERQLLALPHRHGGLGLTNPQTTAKTEFTYSILITAKLTDQIYNQKLNLEYNPSDRQYTTTTKSKLRQEKNAKCSKRRNKLFEELTPECQQHIKGDMEKW